MACLLALTQPLMAQQTPKKKPELPRWIAQYRFDAATEKLLKQVEDEGADFDTRFAVMQGKVCNLPTQKLFPALRRLAFDANEEIAALAMIVLIRRDDVKAQEVVESLPLPRQERALSSMIEQLLLRPHPYFFETARRVLKRILAQKLTGLDEIFAGLTAGVAALIMAERTDEESKQLLQQAVTRFSDEITVWLAVVRFGGVTQDNLALAQRKLNGKNPDHDLRDVLIIVLATQNPEAAKEYTQDLKKSLAAYAQLDDKTMLQLMQSEKLSLLDALKVNATATRVARLRFLRSSDVESLTFAALQSKSSQIRTAALFVAAERYTERLLVLLSKQDMTKQFPITQKEREDALAFIALRSPKYASQARALLKDPDHIQRRLQRETILGAFWQGEAFIGLR